jgi:regulator of sigma E protease
LTASPGLLIILLSFLACIGPLIFIHELGHYFAGRWFGVKAETFSIGFGREVVGWMPLGGYVKFKGDMNPAGVPAGEWLSLPAEERAQTFQAKPLWQRAIIVAAGPAVNFLFAIIVYMVVFGHYGEPRTRPLIAGVLQGSAAERAGLAPGDLVVSINGKSIDRFEDIASYVAIRPGKPMTITAERGGHVQSFKAVSGSEISRDSFGNSARIGRLGIAGDEARGFAPIPWYGLPGAAVRQTVDTVQAMVVALGQVIGGDRSVKELGGPLKVAQYSGQQASLGWFSFLMFMTLISINLGFINLLPIPMLDGGHLLFYLVEAVRRKPLPPQAVEWAFRTGLAALLVMMLFVTFNDLASFGLWNRLGGLIG